MTWLVNDNDLNTVIELCGWESREWTTKKQKSHRKPVHQPESSAYSTPSSRRCPLLLALARPTTQRTDSARGSANRFGFIEAGSLRHHIFVHSYPTTV